MNWRKMLGRDAQRDVKDRELARLELRTRIIEQKVSRVSAESDQLVRAIRGTVAALRHR